MHSLHLSHTMLKTELSVFIQILFFISSPSRSLPLYIFKSYPRFVLQLLHNFFLWTSRNSVHTQHLTMLLHNNCIIIHDSICLFHIILPPSFINVTHWDFGSKDFRLSYKMPNLTSDVYLEPITDYVCFFFFLKR